MPSRESAPPFTWTALQGPETLALAWKPTLCFFQNPHDIQGQTGQQGWVILILLYQVSAWI